MYNYRVKSGTLDVNISAKNRKMAVIKAIDENDPTALGLLVSIRSEGGNEDDEIFMKTEAVLKDMGFDVLES